jgi:MarR family transcriptional regulator, lower aerobic nicotinate degradation pathway regulator
LDALLFHQMNVVDPHSVSSPLLPGPPKALLASPTFLLKRLGFAAKERTFAAFEQSGGLNAFHYAVLALLDEDPRETQAVIADALGYDRSHLVRLLDELEERELVVRKRDPEDRRRHVVKMTAAGKDMLARMREIVHGMEDDFLAPLDADQRQALHGLLLRLMTHHDPRCSVFGPLAPSSD